MTLESKYHTDWENLAQLDPKWVILTNPNKKYGKWDEKEFFDTGIKDIKKLLTNIKNLNINLEFKEALDFGCGIGRLTNALSEHFDIVYGVDISPTMITTAKNTHKENKKITFIHNTNNDLSCFTSNKFNLVCSLITLQHIPKQKDIENYLLEFIRILKPSGLLYFQLPTSPRYTRFNSMLLGIRDKIYYLLTGIGLSKKYCFYKLKLMPITFMNYIPIHEIETLFSGKATILEIYDKETNSPRYLVRKEKDFN